MTHLCCSDLYSITKLHACVRLDIFTSVLATLLLLDFVEILYMFLIFSVRGPLALSKDKITIVINDHWFSSIYIHLWHLKLLCNLQHMREPQIANFGRQYLGELKLIYQLHQSFPPPAFLLVIW